MSDLSFKIRVSEHCPPDELQFVVPRRFEIVRLPSGEWQKVWLESEEEWARKCGVIKGLKT